MIDESSLIKDPVWLLRCDPFHSARCMFNTTGKHYDCTCYDGWMLKRLKEMEY